MTAKAAMAMPVMRPARNVMRPPNEKGSRPKPRALRTESERFNPVINTRARDLSSPLIVGFHFFLRLLKYHDCPVNERLNRSHLRQCSRYILVVGQHVWCRFFHKVR